MDDFSLFVDGGDEQRAVLARLLRVCVVRAAPAPPPAPLQLQLLGATKLPV